MPYLKHPGIIFVAIPKTGSTSMTRALRALASVDNPLRLQRTSPPRSELIAKGEPTYRSKHLTALEIRNLLGEKEFFRCLKFAVVRNSWSRVASMYYFTHVKFEPSPEQKQRRATQRKFHNLSFDDWMERSWQNHKQRENPQACRQLEMILDHDGSLMVDIVGRLESVQDTLDLVTTRLGVQSIEMPHVSGTRQGHYSHLFTPKTRDMVAELFRKEIDYFNFEYEEASER